MNKKKKKIEKWLILIILSGLLIKIFGGKKIKTIKNNFGKFAEKEKKEMEELTAGKEGFKKFFGDSGSLFKDYFIPHDGNGHKPKILRPKSLVIIAAASLLVKIGVSGFLFFIYPKQAETTEKTTDKLLGLINQERENNNLGSLTVNPTLTAAALSKAEDMLAKNYFSHNSPDGKKPWDWIDRNEYAYLYVGENLAMNFSSAQNVHQALMQSPTHKKVILNGNYRDLGLAVLSGKINGQKTAVLVELFAGAKTALPALSRAENNIPPAGKISAAENPNFTEESGAAATSTVVAAAEESFISPNQELESGSQSEISLVNVAQEEKNSLAYRLTLSARYFYLALLIFIILSLLINIFVKIKIQHKPVIIQTLFVILFIASLALVRIHLLENIFERIMIV